MSTDSPDYFLPNQLMPFTPTHILAVVPLAGLFRRLPMSALAIGSMIPDLPMFIPFAPNYLVTHSPMGVFTACLPMGAAAFLFFQYFVKVPVVSLFPNWVQARMMTCANPLFLPSIRSVLFVLMAIVIGAYSHIIWDAFTHQGRWGTQVFPILYETTVIAGKHVPGYKLFQYGSTVVGLPALALLCVLWLRRRTASPIKGLYPYGRRAKLLFATVVVAIPVLVGVFVLATSTGNAYSKLASVIITSGQFAMTALILYSLVFQLATRGKYVA